MYVEQDNKVHFDKSDLIDPVIPSPFWKKTVYHNDESRGSNYCRKL